MSCPKTPHLLTEYFADDLLPLARQEMDNHLAQCQDCHDEMDLLLRSQQSLAQWQDEKPLHWDRGVELFKREHHVAKDAGWSGWNKWQWFPLAGSFAMLCIMLLNVSVSTGAQGLTIAFGSGQAAEIDSRLAGFEQQQQSELQLFLTRLEERQDGNSLRLMEAVMEQSRQANLDNYQQLYAYFEQQRQQDMETVQLSYQQLADSDYDTIRSLQQLTNFVSFQQAR